MEEFWSERKARGVSDDGIDAAVGTDSGLARGDPFLDGSWEINGEAVEAAAGLALKDFGAVMRTMLVGQDMIGSGLFVTLLGIAQNFTSISIEYFANRCLTAMDNLP